MTMYLSQERWGRTQLGAPTSRASWLPVPPNLHQTVPRPAPEPHRSTSYSNKRYYGEAPVGLRWGDGDERAVGDATPAIPLKTAKNLFCIMPLVPAR
jgi:hypothetical protein